MDIYHIFLFVVTAATNGNLHRSFLVIYYQCYLIHYSSNCWSLPPFLHVRNKTRRFVPLFSFVVFFFWVWFFFIHSLTRTGTCRVSPAHFSRLKLRRLADSPLCIAKNRFVSLSHRKLRYCVVKKDGWGLYYQLTSYNSLAKDTSLWIPVLTRRAPR